MDVNCKCPFCGATTTVDVGSKAKLMRYRAGGLVQSVFPDMDDFSREALVSGMCFDCQQKMYNMPKPGEDWGKQAGDCPVCDRPVWVKDLKDGKCRCGGCMSDLQLVDSGELIEIE